MQQVQNGVVQTAQEEADAYRDGETRPLGGYVVIMAVFGALLSGAAGLSYSRRGGSCHPASARVGPAAHRGRRAQASRAR